MNKQLSETIARKIDLLRLSATCAKECQDRLNELEKKAVILASADILRDYTKAQINANLKAIDSEIDAIFDELGEEYEELQENIADNENDFLIGLFGASVLTLGNLKNAVNNANLSGISAKQANTKQAFDLKYELSAVIRNAWVTTLLNKKAVTEKVADTVSLIKSKFKKIKNRIGLTVTNLIDTTTENVRYQYTMHNEAINALMHISVLDNKTSAICTARNGCIWDKESKDGINTDLPFELPPLHPHCRSHIYGVNTDEETVKNAVYRGEDWVKERTLEELQEQFGKQAGLLLKNGDITLTQAIDKYGLKRLTLKQIREKIPAQSVQSFNFERKFNELENFTQKAKEKGLSVIQARNTVKNWQHWQLGVLNKQVQEWLNSETNLLTLSADTLVKQLFNHPDLNIQTYLNLINLINKADFIVKENEFNITFLIENNNKWQQATIKSTKNRKEIFLSSTYRTNKKRVKDKANFEFLKGNKTALLDRL